MAENDKAVSSTSSLELDPLLKDLNEKKQSFRRNVISLAAELKEVRTRLALQEESFARETQLRQVAEAKTKNLEKEIGTLQRFLNHRDYQLQLSFLASEKYLKELDDLWSKLSVTHATAEASAASAQSAQAQCLSLLKELDEKNSCIKENELRVVSLGEQLDLLQKNLQERELSQKQLKEHVLEIEKEIHHAITKAGDTQDCELRGLLDEVSLRNFEKLNKLLISKDNEIAQLKDEISLLSAHWKRKANEVESQLDKQKRADQELKKKVLKLEFCLQETRTQMRKLQRAGEKREMALKELREQIAIKQHGEMSRHGKNFWVSTGFKVVVSMSMLLLVAMTRR